MGGVGAAWLAYVAAATFRWERDHPSSIPRPGIYVGSALLFSVLSLVATSEKARPAAAAMGWALVTAQLVGGTWAAAIPGTAGIVYSPGSKTADKATTATKAAPSNKTTTAGAATAPGA